MSKHLQFETSRVVRPLLLLIDTADNSSTDILNLLIEAFCNDVNVYVLSKKKVSLSAAKISPLGIHLLDRIREQIDYAILFLESHKQKKDVLHAISNLSVRNVKILLLIPVRKKADFIDVYLELKQYKNITIFFVGDVFGKRFKHTKLSQLILSSLKDLRVYVHENGLESIFPISQEDFIHAAKHILLGVKNPLFCYNAYYKNPQTVLSLAHQIQVVEPELSVSFIQGTYKGQESFSNSQRILYDRTGIKPEYVKSVYGFIKSTELLSHIRNDLGIVSSKKIYGTKKRNLLKYLPDFMFKALIAFLLYAVVSFICIVLSTVFLSQGVEDLLSGNLYRGTQKLAVSNSLYKFSLPTLSLAVVIPRTMYTGSIYEYIKLFKEVQEGIPLVLEIAKDFEKNKTLSYKQLNTLKSFSVSIYFLSQQFSEMRAAGFTSSKNYKNIERMLPLISYIPEVGGYISEKSYVLLFQNSNELRPTGGFIGSVGYITVDKGNIKSLQVEDVYDLDGQLKGHVEPHYIIRRYLQPSLYLRDSNFNPDFDVSASSSAFLYNLESKRKIDGVIAVDTNVLQKLIEIAGPITLDTSDKQLNSKNAAEVLHESIHKDYFEGSTKKKQLLGELVKKLMVVYESDNKKKLKFIQVLPDLLVKKHILFSFPSSSLQNAFVAAGLSGSLKDTRLSTYEIPDFLSINEANIGVNKVNSKISRRVSYSAYLEQNKVFSDAALTLENSGEDLYKAYIRFIIPKEAVVTSVIINGQLQQIVPAVVNPILFERKAFKAPDGLEVDSEVQDNHKMVGFILNTLPFTTSNIHLLYTTKYDIKKSNIDYSLLYIKQPGVPAYSLLSQISASDEYKFPIGAQSILFSGKVDQDIEASRTLLKVR